MARASQIAGCHRQSKNHPGGRARVDAGVLSLAMSVTAPSQCVVDLTGQGISVDHDDHLLRLAAFPVQRGKTGIACESIAGKLQPQSGVLADRLRAMAADTNSPGLTLNRFARGEGAAG